MGKDWKAEQARKDKEIEEAVFRLFTKWMFRICRTSTVAILGFFLWLGTKIAENSERVMKALGVLFGEGK